MLETEDFIIKNKQKSYLPTPNRLGNMHDSLAPSHTPKNHTTSQICEPTQNQLLNEIQTNKFIFDVKQMKQNFQEHYKVLAALLVWLVLLLVLIIYSPLPEKPLIKLPYKNSYSSKE